MMSKQGGTVRNGEGTSLWVLGTGVRFLCEAHRTDGSFSLMEVTVPKDAEIPLHNHPWDESYYVLEGTVCFQLGDEVQVLERDDFIYAPSSTPHGFKGLSEQPTRLLVLDVPATAAEFFKAVDREVKADPADLAKLPDIAVRHNIQFAPPDRSRLGSSARSS